MNFQIVTIFEEGSFLICLGMPKSCLSALFQTCSCLICVLFCCSNFHSPLSPVSAFACCLLSTLLLVRFFVVSRSPGAHSISTSFCFVFCICFAVCSLCCPADVLHCGSSHSGVSFALQMSRCCCPLFCFDYLGFNLCNCFPFTVFSPLPFPTFLFLCLFLFRFRFLFLFPL